MNYKEIQAIINDFKKSELTYLELESKDFKIKLSKQKDNNIKIDNNNNQSNNTNETSKNIELQTTSIPKEKIGTEIKSPLVGTFYASVSPDSKPYVQVGDFVNKGDTVCIVEAMKIMNEITSEVTGKVIDIKFENGAAVGFDDALFVVDENVTK